MLRFAPTLDNEIHIGNFRILLINWIFAKKFNKKLILRIDFKEFTDQNKENTNLNNLLILSKSIGIDFDEIIFQKNRIDLYKSVFNKLLNDKKVYLVDDIYCLKLQKNEYSIFNDEVFGEMKKKTEFIKNPVIYDPKKEIFFYNFSSVIDDIFNNIEIIIRGADHIDNTFLQNLMIKTILESYSLNMKINFAHIPLVFKENGSKISKKENIDEFKIKNLIIDKEILLISLIHYLIFSSIKPQKNLKEYLDLFYFKIISKVSRKFNFLELNKINKKLLNTFNNLEIYNYLLNLDYNFDIKLIEIFIPYIENIKELKYIKNNIDNLNKLNILDKNNFIEIIKNINHQNFEKEYLKYFNF